jgi:hypothetical protein
MSILTEIAMRMTTLGSLALATALSTSAAAADPSRLSEASELSAVGAVSIAEGSLIGIRGSAEFVVDSLESAGRGLKVALKGSAKVGRVVLMVPLTMAGGLSLAVGEMVTLVATGAGWLITRAGEVIGFIPNEAGRALLHSRRVKGSGA